MQEFVFLVAAIIVLAGSVGVLLAKNPVHAALFLIQTLFGVAVLFLIVEAHFLAAIQVIVYAGAIVILFLFVIMLLGVDKSEDLSVDPIVGQRPLAFLSGGAILGLLLALLNTVDPIEPLPSADPARALDRTDASGQRVADVNQLAETIFGEHVLAFEITGLLLTVAVVGAVVMARKISGDLQPVPESALAASVGLEETSDDDAEPADAGEGDA
ncbi:MAG: NADH-quinone oxidoreductase subunit J [Acidimicrobiales bacterium]|nr:NADH-quinone oxidoreductase subunit J [Acidimicrobiales bacterium]